MNVLRITGLVCLVAAIGLVGCDTSKVQAPQATETEKVMMGPDGPISSIPAGLRRGFAPRLDQAQPPTLPPVTTLATIPGRDMGGGDLLPANGDVLSGTFTNVRNFIIPVGTSVKVATASPLSVSAVNIVIAGTLDGSGAGYAGGPFNPYGGSQPGSPGSGPGRGAGGQHGPCIHGPGAGGGGHGGAGGGGGSTLGSPPDAPGGAAYGTAAPPGALMGSGGGAASNHSCNETGRGGAGGSGGAAITLTALSITVSGSLLASGANGGVGIPTLAGGNYYYVSGGGGGAGGGIWLSGELSLTGVLNARGGSGGNVPPQATVGFGTGGGGGGGGRIKLSGCTTINTATIQASGGTPGNSAPYSYRLPQAGGTGTYVSQTGVCTPPVIVPTVTGTLSPSGWYTSDVSVSWSITDPETPITSTEGCEAVTVTEDTNGRTFTCTATSSGGTASASVTIKRDTSGPTVTPSLAGILGSNGWYTSDVALAWTVSDPASPILTKSGCDAASVTENTTGATFTCTATSEGGTTSSSVTVKRDTTVPTVSPSLVGTLGNDGWYVTNVSVSWSVTGGISGVASSSGCGPATLADDTAGRTFTCEATSGAGLVGTGSVSVKRDASVPVVTPSLAGTLGSNGWYVSDVAVSWSATGGVSGVTLGEDCAATTLAEDTAEATFTCTATSGAGLLGTGNVTVKRDTTVPTVTPSLVGTLGSNGWYVSDVVVSWSATGGVSGVSLGEGCAATTLAEDTAGQTFTCAATSGAGLVGTGTVSAKRDATLPLIGYQGNLGSYQVDQSVSITCSASDAMSGLASSTCADVVGEAYGFALGVNTFSASATDVAGNLASATTSFTVGVTTGSLCTLVQRFVTQAGVANSLCAKLDAAAKAKTAQARAGQIGAFINEVNAQAGKKISREHAAILIQLAGEL